MKLPRLKPELDVAQNSQLSFKTSLLCSLQELEGTVELQLPKDSSDIVHVEQLSVHFRFS